MLRRLTIVVLAMSMLLAFTVPANATGADEPDVVDVVLAVSGTEGFDHNAHDFDLLREALVAADLVGALQDADDITVWAPKRPRVQAPRPRPRLEGPRRTQRVHVHRRRRR